MIFNPKHKTIRIIAIIVCVCFLWQQAAWAAGPQAQASCLRLKQFRESAGPQIGLQAVMAVQAPAIGDSAPGIDVWQTVKIAATAVLSGVTLAMFSRYQSSIPYPLFSVIIPMFLSLFAITRDYLVASAGMFAVCAGVIFGMDRYAFNPVAYHTENGLLFSSILLLLYAVNRVVWDIGWQSGSKIKGFALYCTAALGSIAGSAVTMAFLGHIYDFQPVVFSQKAAWLFLFLWIPVSGLIGYFLSDNASKVARPALYIKSAALGLAVSALFSAPILFGVLLPVMYNHDIAMALFYISAVVSSWTAFNAVTTAIHKGITPPAEKRPVEIATRPDNPGLNRRDFLIGSGAGAALLHNASYVESKILPDKRAEEIERLKRDFRHKLALHSAKILDGIRGINSSKHPERDYIVNDPRYCSSYNNDKCNLTMLLLYMAGVRPKYKSLKVIEAFRKSVMLKQRQYFGYDIYHGRSNKPPSETRRPDSEKEKDALSMVSEALTAACSRKAFGVEPVIDEISRAFSRKSGGYDYADLKEQSETAQLQVNKAFIEIEPKLKEFLRRKGAKEKEEEKREEEKEREILRQARALLLTKMLIGIETLYFNKYAVFGNLCFKGITQLGADAAKEGWETTLGNSMDDFDYFDPNQNIQAAAAYMVYLLKRFEDKYGVTDADARMEFALAGFNAGETRLREWVFDNTDVRDDFDKAMEEAIGKLEEGGDQWHIIKFARSYAGRGMSFLTIYKGMRDALEELRPIKQRLEELEGFKPPRSLREVFKSFYSFMRGEASADAAGNELIGMLIYLGIPLFFSISLGLYLAKVGLRIYREATKAYEDFLSRKAPAPLVQKPVVQKLPRQAEMPDIKVIFFDIGGVLLECDYDLVAKNIAEQLGVTNEKTVESIKKYVTGEIMIDFETGKLSKEEYLEGLNMWLRDNDEIGTCLEKEDFERIYTNKYTKIDENIKVAERLKAEGYTLIALTNTSEIDTEFLNIEFSDVMGLFKGYVASYKVGQLKPHQDMYKAALEKADEVLDVEILRAQAVLIEDVEQYGTKSFMRCVIYKPGVDLGEAIDEALKGPAAKDAGSSAAASGAGIKYARNIAIARAFRQVIWIEAMTIRASAGWNSEAEEYGHVILEVCL